MPTKPPSKSPLKRILTLVSGVAFLFSSAGLLVRLLNTPNPNEQPTTTTESVVDQLKSQEEGYKLVLQREPDNTNALKGLVDTRLQLNDLEGAIAPLEKLVSLYPEDESIKLLLATVKQQVAALKQQK